MADFWIKRRRAFRYAWQGISTMFRQETHARIHLLAMVCVVAVGFVVNLTRVEWCLVLLCIGGVFMAEAFNSAIERVCNHVSPQWNPLIKDAKDLAAGAVLLLVIFVVIVGLIVFVPHFLEIIQK